MFLRAVVQTTCQGFSRLLQACSDPADRQRFPTLPVLTPEHVENVRETCTRAQSLQELGGRPFRQDCHTSMPHGYWCCGRCGRSAGEDRTVSPSTGSRHHGVAGQGVKVLAHGMDPSGCMDSATRIAWQATKTQRLLTSNRHDVPGI